MPRRSISPHIPLLRPRAALQSAALILPCPLSIRDQQIGPPGKERPDLFVTSLKILSQDNDCHPSKIERSDSFSAAFTLTHRFQATGSISFLISRSTQSRNALGSIASSSQHSCP